MDVGEGDAAGGSSEADGEIRAHFRYQLWSSASQGLASRSTGGHRYGSIGNHDAANGLNDPAPDPHGAAGSDTLANPEHFSKYAARGARHWPPRNIGG
jgi:hypothetical protein